MSAWIQQKRLERKSVTKGSISVSKKYTGLRQLTGIIGS